MVKQERKNNHVLRQLTTIGGGGGGGKNPLVEQIYSRGIMFQILSFKLVAGPFVV